MLRSLHILDTPPEERFDRLIRLVCTLLRVPISNLTLIDEDRQWYKSRQGMTGTESDRATAFCGHVVANAEALIISDARQDPRFFDNPFVVGQPGIRAYAGFPIIVSDGSCVGTLSAMDTTPRQFTPEELTGLEDLAAIATEEISKVELNQAMERLHYLASHDSLTGLLNRSGFEAAVERILATEAIVGKSFLLYLDLDNFKIINDSFGHKVGDKVLKRASAILRETCGESAYCARLGGDEFVVLLLNLTFEEARALGDSLRDKIDNYLFTTGEEPVHLSTSLGLSVLEEKTTVSRAIDRADTACYLAKSRGRNRIEIQEADSGEIKTLRSDIGWQRRIRDAFRYETLKLWYQPIIDLATGEVVECEALARLCDRPEEIVTPVAFLSAIERFQLSVDFDHYILRRAAAVLQAQPRLKLAVNLSAAAVLDSTLLTAIKETFRQAAVDSSRVTLEITEHQVIGNLNLARILIGQLRELGFHFALDDFGAGFSSFNYLKMLPVTSVKIDGSFIRDLRGNPSSRVFVKAMSEIAHAFKIKSLAESVEDQVTLDMLREIGVDQAQGYFIGMPAPEPVFEATPGIWT